MSNMNLVPANKLKRNRMDLTYKHLFSGDMALLYPVGYKYCIPGDKVSVGTQIFLRMMPMVSPILTSVRVKTRTFFMPFTAMKGPDEDFDFQHFYKQGKDGKDDTMKIPKWTTPSDRSLGSLWNFLVGPNVVIPVTDLEHTPDKFLLWMYNYIVNHFFISPDIEDKRDLEDDSIFRVNWRKDYFGGCTLQQQRGVSPTLPTRVGFTDSDGGFHDAVLSQIVNAQRQEIYLGGFDTSTSTTPTVARRRNSAGSGTVLLSNTVTSDNIYEPDNPDTWNVPLTTTPVSVNDLRLAFAVQRYLETNNRAGSRYVDQLKVRFGIAPRDENLLEPQFIGGSTTPIIVSEE